MEQVRLRISTGIKPLDELIGGWERGRITLLVGKTGVGKTTLLLSSAIAMCEEGDVIYVDCEGNFSGDLAAHGILPEGLRISSPTSPEDQLKTIKSLDSLGKVFLSSVAAIIVDGIAFHYHPWIRSAEDDAARNAAQSWLETQFYQLSNLARRHNIAVVASSWPTSEPDTILWEEGTGIVGGFAASAFSRTILEMYFVSDTRRGIRVTKHQNPELVKRSVEIELNDLPLFRRIGGGMRAR